MTRFSDGVSPRLIETMKSWLADADRVFVGAGAGLSAAAGIDYTDRDDFRKTFPELARRGIQARYQMIGRTDLTETQFWAYWARHVLGVRFAEGSDATYGRLSRLISGKTSFVLTSNVDAMFVRNGFAPERVHTPQGDYARLQCRKPCRKTTWPSRPILEQVLANTSPDGFELTEPSLVPRCPHCGGAVFLNVRIDHGFVEQPYRDERQFMGDWLKRTAEGQTVFLEIGAGFNTPGVIRWPMEHLAASIPNSRLIRINLGNADVPRELGGRALSVLGHAGNVIAEITG